MTTAAADEGMWLLNDPPHAKLQERYGFDLTDPFLQRAMHASVRFNNGGSGGFVSPDGLIVTNHHIGADSLQKLTRPGRDLIADGYLAKTRADELKCPDLELNVLQSIEDVTDRVKAAVKPGQSAAEAAAARRAVLSAIEKESLDSTGLRSDVVTLYQGGVYHLYRYQKYTDVRLVFAPESAAAAFGGDVDNFEYPRFGFDVCFFRAYQNDKPVNPSHYFPWSKTGVAEGDLVFVTGHPGTTNRLETVARLKYRRDFGHPYQLARLRAMESALIQFSETGPDARRVAATDLHRVANARKVISGQFQALLDPAVMARKEQEENALRSADPKPWEAIEKTQSLLRSRERQMALLERGEAFSSELFAAARHLVRLAAELPKPSGDRLREYRTSNLDSLKFQLFSPAPIDPTLEVAKLSASLTFLAEALGDRATIEIVLAGKTPRVRAAELVAGCKLFDVAERKRIFDAGPAAIDQSADTMIQLARTIDPAAREVRKFIEEQVDEPERQAYSRIAEIRFEKFGRTIAPDATFTLRLAFGRVSGYDEDGVARPYQTTVAGLFQRAGKMGGREPFVLADRWKAAQSKLDPTTPMNFVSTADTIGGNSGSPVVNRDGELVGINFDRNRPGLVRNFVYSDVQARHIAVHGGGVVAALKTVYGANDLARELVGQ
ncbi:MAG: S46 family peptidase [Gemmataceae bacterium]|nr:S46 family peptidase [Gemmataceae bacterium]